MIRRGEEAVIDADFVRYRLEEAGKCLLSLPAGRVGPATLSAQSYGFVSEVVEGSDYVPRLKVAVPDAATISRMDEALAWLSLIPNDRKVLRRIVAALSLISPVTDRRVYSLQRLAKAIGADKKAVENWHTQGIAIIVAALRARREAEKAPRTTTGPKAFKALRTLPQPPDARVLGEAEWQRIFR